jgi:hypothetical protein
MSEYKNIIIILPMFYIDVGEIMKNRMLGTKCQTHLDLKEIK